jgi:hypothetical protein
MIDEILNKLRGLEPEYKVTLPNSKKEVAYTPFKMKDQKTLSLIAEEKSIGSIVKNLCELLRSCSSEKKPELLHISDFEYLFLQIRGKSVEEKIDLIIEDDKKISFALKIDDIKFEPGIVSKNLVVVDNIILELKQPTVMDYISVDSLDENLLFTRIVKTITIDKHRYDLSILKTQDIQKILDEVYLKHSNPLKEFLKSGPKLTYAVVTEDKTITIEGFLRFFI